MKIETLKILNDADDSVEWEAPKDFNWHKSMARVRALKSELEHIIGRSLEIDEQVQDASFLTHLCLLHSFRRETSPKILLNICFSNFGRLFTIWSDYSTDEFSGEMLQQVKTTIESHGFQFVDSSELNELYTGSNEAIRNATYMGSDKYTWAIRFFSYI